MKVFKILALTGLAILLISQSAIAQARGGSGATVVRGELLYVVCASDVRVRAADLKTILFQADGYERIKTFQGWGENKKTTAVNGVQTTFAKVQFADQSNRGDGIGWIAQKFIQLKSNCSAARNAPSRQSTDRINIQDDLRTVRGLSDSKCCLFPISHSPDASYISGERMFGWNRSGGRRKHAGADLYGNMKENIRAIAPGKVLRGPYAYWGGTYAIEVQHADGFVVVYGEVVGNVARGIENGARLRTGQVVGFMGRVKQGGHYIRPPMLHFELYSGKKSGAILQPGRRPYMRRADIMEPTNYLRKWERATL